MMNVYELYAGAGRSSAPFGFDNISLLVDVDEHARESYLANYPGANYITRDLATTSAEELLAQGGGPPDIVLGCPPCQGFSESGKRDWEDPRNNHVIRFAELAVRLAPWVVAMENVPMAAASPQFERAIEILEAAGYEWTAGVLNAAEYGSAQCRQRLVMIACLRCLGVAPELPSPTHRPDGEYFDYVQGETLRFDGSDDDLLGTTSSSFRARDSLPTRYFDSGTPSPTPTVEVVLAGLPEEGSPAAELLDHRPWDHTSKMLATMERVPEGGQRDNGGRYFGAAYARLHRRGLARTITTYFPNAGSGRYWHPTANRSLTLREGARIQGFPDDFSFIGGSTDANRTLVGNALDAALAKAKCLAAMRILDSV
jgi:DNA (cytosine-5)-methyltransferase 1